MAGTPASSAGASFSAGPQTGKLYALICTAAPRRGVRMCCPANVPPWPSGSACPSGSTGESGSPRRPRLANTARVPMAPSMSTAESRRVAPVRADSAYSSSRAWVSTPATALTSGTRSAKVSARSAGPPTSRAWRTAAATSTPARETRATGTPVTASRTGSPAPAGRCHAPAR